MRTRLIGTLLSATALCGLAAAPAAAQIARTSVWNRVDVSMHVVRVSGDSIDSGDLDTSAAGPVFTFNINEHHAIQVVAELAKWETTTRRYSAVAETIEYRRTFDTPLERTRFFFTTGVMGVIQKSTVKSNGVRHSSSYPPIIPMASFGMEVFFGPRVGVRADAGIAGVPGLAAFRGGIGLVVSTGRMRPRTESTGRRLRME